MKKIEDAWVCAQTVAIGFLTGNALVKGSSPDIRRGDLVDVTATVDIVRVWKGSQTRTYVNLAPRRVVRVVRGEMAPKGVTAGGSSSEGAQHKFVRASQNEFDI